MIKSLLKVEAQIANPQSAQTPEPEKYAVLRCFTVCAFSTLLLYLFKHEKRFNNGLY